MLKSLLTGALFAGFAAGLLAAVLHFAFLQSLILTGEEYESGLRVHFNGVAAGAAPASHDHDHNHGAPAAAPDSAGTEPAGTEPAETGHDAAGADGHDHDHAEGAGAEDPSPLSRNALTVLFYALTYSGYAMMLMAGMVLAERAGRRIGPAEGLLWGLAGFACVQLAPALGMAPELPGTPAADLDARQLWWLGTAASTALGIGLLAYGKRPLGPIAAVALLALPHVIGAPELEGYFGVAPPELASAFAARSLGVALAVWLALGWLAARLRPQGAAA